jgi:hypothetical protein
VGYNGYGFTRGGSDAFTLGFAGYGAILSLTPVEGLGIYFGIPYAQSQVAEDVYKKLMAQVAYSISGIGEVAVTFKGGSGKVVVPEFPVYPAGGYGWKYDKDSDGNLTSTPPTWDPLSPTADDIAEYNAALAAAQKAAYTAYGDPAKIYAQFYLTAVENLGVNIGFKYALPISQDDVTYSSPIAVGLGASYNVSDTFGIRARFAATFAGTVTNKAGPSDIKYEEGFKFGANILPWFDLSIVKVFINLGMEYQGDAKFGDNKLKADQPLSWYVNPFITKSVGSGTFYAGLQLGGAPDNSDLDTNKDHIFFSVPIGLEVAF